MSVAGSAIAGPAEPPREQQPRRPRGKLFAGVVLVTVALAAAGAAIGIGSGRLLGPGPARTGVTDNGTLTALATGRRVL